MAVVFTAAISCWPGHLRTTSSPLAKEAQRKVRSTWRGAMRRTFHGCVITCCKRFVGH
jgi:hypothetical protein